MKIVKLLLQTLVFCALAGPCFGQASFGKPEKINAGWKFVMGDIENAVGIDFDDKLWQTVDLPHDWSVKGCHDPSYPSCMGYLPAGIGLYRKHIEVPESYKGERLYIYFEGVYNRSEVWLNGNRLGYRPNGYVSFMYDITPFVDFGEKNVITVRVDHSRGADSRWYTGSGIYRNVWLIKADNVHIDLWGVNACPDVTDKNKGLLNVDVDVVNTSAKTVEISVLNELFAPDGKLVAKNDSDKIAIRQGDKTMLKCKLEVQSPQLWDLNNPQLYTLRTTVLRDGKAIDSSMTETGFRKFTFDPDKGFALNDEWIKIKGVCLHHDAGALGAAVPGEVWESRIKTLKDIGCNAIRMTHNPQATELYELCDRLGMLVMDEVFDEWEFPKRKWLQGWNVGTPGYEGAYDFFEEWGERDLADVVRRDRNHISIFAWSVGNEVDYPNDPYSHPVLDGDAAGFSQPIFGGYKKDAPDAMRLGVIAKRLAAVVKQYDTSRPVTAGLAGVAMSNQTEYPDALDIVGYNYTESMYESDHEKYPDRVIYGSENRHDFNAWKEVRDNEYIFGQFLWTGIDYLGESNAWPSRGFGSGLIDLGGFMKPLGYFRKSLWSEEPMAYIGTFTGNRNPYYDSWPNWNYKEGEMVNVVCFTNASHARLELNGRNVGESKPYDDKTGYMLWTVPYSAGKLEVISSDAAGKELCRYELHTSGKAERLDVETIGRPSKDGIVEVVIRIVDNKGIQVMSAQEEITCFIEDPSTILGLESGNNTDMSNNSDYVCKTHHGQLKVYVKLGKGVVTKIQITAPGFKSKVVALKS
jgi:hypothetical protein